MKNKSRLLTLATILLLLPLALSQRVQAASFDCEKAATKIERMICENSELSRLDEQLAKQYSETLKASNNPDSVKTSQKGWLTARNKVKDTDSLKQAYATRLNELRKPPETVQTASGLTETKTPAQNPETGTPKEITEPPYGHCVDVQGPKHCGRFQSGKGYVICEKYLAYINSLPKIPQCEVPVPPGFTRPDWEEVDVMQHLDWAYQMEMNGYVPLWYIKENPTFDVWKKNFQADLQADRITPSMLKVRVRPFGEEEITILAYARDREGCRRIIEKKSKGSLWNKVGYSHFLFSESPEPHLSEINGAGTEIVAMKSQSEMLIFNGHPYFVIGFDYHVKPEYVSLVRFDKHLSKPDKEYYRVEDQCFLVEKEHNPYYKAQKSGR